MVRSAHVAVARGSEPSYPRIEDWFRPLTLVSRGPNHYVPSRLRHCHAEMRKRGRN